MAKVETRNIGEQLNMFASNIELSNKKESKETIVQEKTVFPENAIEFKSSSVLAVTAVLHTSDREWLDASLKDAAGPDGDFFANDITVIDLSALTESQSQIDWPVLIETFKSYRLNPVVVRNARPDLEPAILACGLGIDVVGLARPAAAPQSAPTPETALAIDRQPEKAIAVLASEASDDQQESAPALPMTTMIIDTPVRSGSRIYAANADVVITAVVNPGAEIIADGSIHVYAPLKGRALAGAKGNADARIFALSMEAELVSIAGVYSTFEDGPDPKFKERPTQIRLIGNRLEIQSIDSQF